MVSGEEAGTMLAGASSCPKLSLLRKTIESFSELSAYLSTLETGVPSRLGRDPEFHILVTISYNVNVSIYHSLCNLALYCICLLLGYLEIKLLTILYTYI